MDWMDILIDDVRGFGEVRHGSSFYERRTVWTDDGRERRPRMIYVPAGYKYIDPDSFGPPPIYVEHPWVSIYSQVAEVASILRKVIIDEDVPLKTDLVGTDDIFRCGGRIDAAASLGMIKYDPAMPELKEAMIHDLSPGMRSSATSALGDMGEMAWYYAFAICDRLIRDNDTYVRVNAAESLGKIGNPSASVVLRDIYEETRTVLHGSQCFDRETIDYCELLRESLCALLKVDPQSGREALTEGLRDRNPHVHHFSKNAPLWSGQWQIAKEFGLW